MKYISLKKYLALSEEEKPLYGILTSCNTCKKHIKRRTYEEYLKDPLCHNCSGKTKKILKSEPINISELNLTNLDAERDKYNCSQKIKFNCEDCGKETTLQLYSIKLPLLCGMCRMKRTNLERYGVSSPFQYKEFKDKAKQTCLERYGVDNAAKSEQVKEKTKQTTLERYGVEYTFQSEECKEKAKQTNLERYGVEYVLQSEECKEKAKQTNLGRYGVDIPSKSEQVKEKAKQTTLERYGSEYYSQSEDYKNKYNEIQIKMRTTYMKHCGVSHYGKSEEYKKNLPKITEKVKQTCLERYGVENCSQLPETKESVKRALKETCQKIYGYDYFTQVPEIKEKVKQTNLKRYGVACTLQDEEVDKKRKETLKRKYNVEHALQNDKIKDKAKQTCLERYGVKYYSQTEDFNKVIRKSFIFENEKFDSSWELYYWIWAFETGHNIIHEPVKFKYVVEGKKHYYFPDFEIDGQLIEIKGPQFFKDGKMINPFDSRLNDIFEAKHQCGLQHGVRFITDISEAKEYVDSKYTSDFVNLFRTNLEFPYPNTKLSNTSDRGLIHHFHKSIWDARVRNNLTPKEAWNDKELIYKVALNRLKYVGSCKPEDILRGFSVTKKAPKVSVFKPSLAKRIIETYATEYTTIFDPFSGFSGRMLGAIRNDKNYIGQDLSEVHIEESKALLNWIKENQGLDIEVSLKCQDILEDKERIFENTCLFTCSPYGSKETWTKGEVQMSCDEWIEVCLSKYKCDSYIFVVDETERYKDYIVETIENKSHFGSNNEYIIII